MKNNTLKKGALNGRWLSRLPVQAGDVIGNWTVLSNRPLRSVRGHASCLRIKCRCKCGHISTPSWWSVRKGNSKSCRRCGAKRGAVLRADQAWGRPKDADDRWLARLFQAVKTRCDNPRSAHYADYGARDIRNEFPNAEAFASYCKTLPSFRRGLEIDRLDTNGNYCRGNIAFTTRKRQVRNRRNTCYVVYGGVTMPVWDFIELRVVKKFHPLTVAKFASFGLTGEQILAREKTSTRAGERYTLKNPRGHARNDYVKTAVASHNP